MSSPEIINIYLPYGDPKRLRLAQVSNWDGQAVAAPRIDLREFAEREESRRTGVYILLGQNPESGAPEAYVGEADNLAKRVGQHKGKDFWSQVIAFTSKSDNFNKAHARYLEAKVLAEAVRVGKFQMANKADSTINLSEFDQAITDTYFGKIRQLLPILGTDLLTEVRKPANDKKHANLTYTVKGFVAHGDRTPDGFVIYEGSTASPEERPGAKKHGAWTLALRKQLLDGGALVEQGGKLVFTRDVEFSSPSAAAAVVSGGPTAGPKAWKDRHGTTLKDLEES